MTGRQLTMRTLLSLFLAQLCLSGLGAAAETAIGEKLLAGPNASSAAVCQGRLELFVSELDHVLTSLRSIDEVTDLFKRYFPVTGCDVEQAEATFRRSHFFASAQDVSSAQDIAYARLFVFDTRPNAPHRGVYVQLGIEKSTGSSRLPFAKIKF